MRTRNCRPGVAADPSLATRHVHARCKHSRPSRGFGRAPLATARPRWVRLALPHRQPMRFRARTQPVFGRWPSLFVRRMCTNICVEWLGSMAETTKSKVVVAMAKLARSQRDCIRPGGHRATAMRLKRRFSSSRLFSLDATLALTSGPLTKQSY